jgi:hypothetical protein
MTVSSVSSVSIRGFEFVPVVVAVLVVLAVATKGGSAQKCERNMKQKTIFKKVSGLKLIRVYVAV